MYGVWYEVCARAKAVGGKWRVAGGEWRAEGPLVRVKIGREADGLPLTAVKRETTAEVEKGASPGFFIYVDFEGGCAGWRGCAGRKGVREFCMEDASAGRRGGLWWVGRSM